MCVSVQMNGRSASNLPVCKGFGKNFRIGYACGVCSDKENGSKVLSTKKRGHDIELKMLCSCGKQFCEDMSRYSWSMYKSSWLGQSPV